MQKDQEILRHNIYVFSLDDRFFGIDIDSIHEVKDLLTAEEITPLPHSQPAVLGYINVRGSVRQVISFRRILGNMNAVVSAGGVIIYCKDEVAPDTGIYSDHPGEILSVEEKDIDRWDRRRGESDEPERADLMTCGACRTPRGIVTLLDPQRLYQIAGEFS